MPRLPFSLALLAALTAACGRTAAVEVEITDVRVVEREFELGLGLIERYSSKDDASAAADAGAGMGRLDYTLPEGWAAQPASRFVMMSFATPGDASCSVSKAGGTLLDNINRWRRQFGHEPTDEAAVQALPLRQFGPGKGYFVELAGPFEDRRGKIADAKMLGLVMPIEVRESLFVKMTGPREVVEAQRDAFFALAASLRAPGRDPHAAGGASPTDDRSEPGAAAAEHGAADLPELRWDVPAGWAEAPQSHPMRRVTIRSEAQPAVECWVTVLGLESGELVWNVNRWHREVGAAELSPAAAAALPTLVVLGGDATLVEAAGDERAVLGLIAPTATHRVFVKLVGPPDAVRACREDFITFCKSLRESD